MFIVSLTTFSTCEHGLMLFSTDHSSIFKVELDAVGTSSQPKKNKLQKRPNKCFIISGD